MSELRKLFETHRDGELHLARQTLTDFMTERALQTRDLFGFDWKAAPDAPNEYAALRRAFKRSQQTGEPLPISSLDNDEVIYLTAESNIAFRYVHDVLHVHFGLSLLAQWHLGELADIGFDASTLPCRMLHADLVGQAFVVKITGQFPVHQRRFVDRCTNAGFELGLIHEVRQIEGQGRG